MKPWYLYLVRCGDGTLYTGISTDVGRRLSEHRAGRGARYLRGRGPLALARKIRVGRKSDAFKLEWQVKKLSRADKGKLIRGKMCLQDLVNPSSVVIKRKKEKGKRKK